MSRTFVFPVLASFFACLSSTAARAQCTTDRLNVDPNGVQANGDSAFNAPNVARNFMCADGHLLAFWSSASNLVANDTNAVNDVFVRNRLTGITTRVSVDSSGVEGNGSSTDPAFSADGRYVAFQSTATNLVPNDTNGKMDVFVRDLQLGLTVRVSLDSSGVESNGDSGRPDLSADGRFVAFHSKGSNLAANDTNNVQDVFVRDLQFAVTNCLSVDDAGTIGNLMSGNPSISANGRWVAFHSNASNLVSSDTNGLTDVFVRDRGNFSTTRVSTNSIDEQGTFISQTPAISADGRYVAFSSAATNLVPGDGNNLFDVFVKDRTTNVTKRASISSTGAQGNDISQGNSISADGRYVAFVSSASNLVPNDTNGGGLNLLTDVFVRDMVDNATERLSIDSLGVEGNTAGSSFNVCVSADASTVAFYSAASNLVAGDTNNFIDVFARSCGGAPPPGAFCSGDGTGTACPCGNNGLHGHGCENSIMTGGGRLAGSGRTSVTNDTFTLAVSGLSAMASALYFQGDVQTAGGAGAVFGDGLRCVGGNVQRIGSRLSTAGGSQFGFAVAGDPLISVQGGVPGGTVSIRYYQAWYRNINAFCTPAPYNLTNGLTVTWIP
jgi:Tol biopolymer transport system component